MPNVIKRFLDAPDRSEWAVRYIARKLGVDLSAEPGSATAVAPPEAPEAPEALPDGSLADGALVSAPDDPAPADDPDGSGERSVAIPVGVEANEVEADESGADDAGPTGDPLPHPDPIPSPVAASDLVASRGADGGHWITHRADRVIGESLRQSGRFQEEAIDDCLALLDALGRPVERRAFVDVGANIGTHSIRALRLGFAHILSIEANPLNHAILNANVALNDPTGRITTRNVAASAAEGTMRMEASPVNFGDHRMSLGREGAPVLHGETEWETVEVVARRLDDVIAEAGIQPSLVWVDTQGHEGHVLAGAPDLLASGCPMVIEFWPYGLERAGGFDLLKPALAARARIVDLDASRPGAVREFDMAGLEAAYATMLSGEGLEGSPHTDLLLL